jgi:glyoxylase-like metal-dependent hydrolase (beta-lactamase superfamily II)
MILYTFPSGPYETNAYLIVCPETQKTAIVDPSPDSSKVLADFIKEHNFHPEKILLTHSHWDHIADVAPLKILYPKIEIYVHTLDAPNLEKPGIDRIPTWMKVTGAKPDHLIHEGDEIHIGTLKFQVIHTPGHTPGGVCFYSHDHHLLLSGDTLFKGTIGNVSFSTGNPKLMWQSLKKLAKLPPTTVVYPGHGPATTIGNEPWLDQAEEMFG